MTKHFDKITKILVIAIIITIIANCIALVIYLNRCLISDKLDDTPTPILDTTTDSIPLEQKYSSVIDWQVYTGDFGVEQLYFLKEQCDKYEIPMEIMLSIICTESSFRSTARASTSSASGYCQIISGTAEWVYEKLLKYGEYDIDNHTEIMTTDWKLNLEIGCRLIYCLYWNSDQSWDIAIQKYYGGSSENNIIYLNKVNSNMIDLFNMTTSDIN